MKNVTLIAATAVIVVANATALIHTARNRAGVDAEITVTSRELVYHRNPVLGRDPDDSAVDLRLSWTDPNGTFFRRRSKTWLDEEKLRSLGFDCRVPAGDAKAQAFYARQLPRSSFVALEYDGPAWQAWLESEQREAEEEHHAEVFERQRMAASHLVTIDADRNPAALRLRHPERGSVLIVPAVIRIVLLQATPISLRELPLKRPAEVTGQIQEIPSTIHVPLPLSDRFQRLRQTSGSELTRYRVGLRYGRLLEPWVTRVELPRD